MTVQELYDSITDRQLKSALSGGPSFLKIKRIHKKHIDRDVFNFEVSLNLYKQAATRWLKDQKS